MSVEALSIVLQHGDDYGLTQGEQLILLGIANHEGDGGAWPSIRTLARYGCMDARSVTRILRRVEARGLVWTRRNAGGLGDTDRPNLYELRIACPWWCDGSSRHRDSRERGLSVADLAGHRARRRAAAFETVLDARHRPHPLTVGQGVTVGQGGLSTGS